METFGVAKSTDLSDLLCRVTSLENEVREEPEFPGGDIAERIEAAQAAAILLRGSGSEKANHRSVVDDACVNDPALIRTASDNVGGIVGPPMRTQFRDPFTLNVKLPDVFIDGEVDAVDTNIEVVPVEYKRGISDDVPAAVIIPCSARTPAAKANEESPGLKCKGKGSQMAPCPPIPKPGGKAKGGSRCQGGWAPVVVPGSEQPARHDHGYKSIILNAHAKDATVVDGVLIVCGLPIDCTEDMIQEIFSQWGTIAYLRVEGLRKYIENYNYLARAEIRYELSHQVLEAARQSDGMMFGSFRLNVHLEERDRDQIDARVTALHS
jgi:hypothetical protein